VLRLRRYERISFQNRRFRFNRGPADPKFHVQGVAPTNHSSQKTRLNYLSYGVKNLDRSFLHFITMHAFERQTKWKDGRTDRILVAGPRLHLMRGGPAVFSKLWYLYRRCQICRNATWHWMVFILPLETMFSAAAFSDRLLPRRADGSLVLLWAWEMPNFQCWLKKRA